MLMNRVAKVRVQLIFDIATLAGCHNELKIGCALVALN